MCNLFSIRKGEWANFLCIAAMMAAVTYVYGILRILKESLVLSHGSAEMISAIKVWVIWPASIVAVIFYMKMSDCMLRTRLFHAANCCFLCFFAFFATVIFPHYDAYCLHLGTNLVSAHPALRYLVAVINKWPCSIFYAFAEMWTTIMLSISTWEVTNHVTTIEQSKRFYPLFGFFRGAGLMLSSVAARYFASLQQDWGSTLNMSIASLVAGGVVLSVALCCLTHNIGFEAINSDISVGTVVKRKKQTASLLESCKHIFASRTVLLITSLLLCYGISLNLIEGVWKKVVELELAGDANRIQRFIGGIYFGVAFFTLVFGLMGGYVFKCFGWRRAALITPLAFLITGGIFFICMACRDSQLMMLLGLPALEVAVYSGAVHQVFSRSSKNSFFDSSKEMVYIPLSAELRTKGKAAAETIGMRFGKGSGALLQQILLALFSGSTLLNLAPFLGICFIAVVFWWLYSTYTLGRIYEKILQE